MNAATAPCRDDQFKCANTGLCIPAFAVCDGNTQCGDYSDERNCSKRYFLLQLFFFCKVYLYVTSKRALKTRTFQNHWPVVFQQHYQRGSIASYMQTLVLLHFQFCIVGPIVLPRDAMLNVVCYANSVRPSVCHTRDLYQNG